MSQASRSKVLARERHRRQVAKMIGVMQAGELHCSYCAGEGSEDGEVCDICLGTGMGRMSAARDIASGGHFNVHAARELGERMVAFERFEGAAQVVDDWRESQGERKCRNCNGSGGAVMGGLLYRCGVCHGRMVVTMPGLPPNFPRDALRWRQHVRMGKRLLEALEGQPSECHGSACVLWRGTPWVDCPDCKGTGHNLRGYLPPIDVSPQLRRRSLDAGGETNETWLGIIPSLDAAQGYWRTKVK